MINTERTPPDHGKINKPNVSVASPTGGRREVVVIVAVAYIVEIYGTIQVARAGYLHEGKVLQNSFEG